MKVIIIKVLSLIILATCFVSCEDFLTTRSKSSFPIEDVFKDASKIQGVLFNAYNIMAQNNVYRNRILLSTDWNTDIEQYSPQNGSTMAIDGGNDAAFSWYAVSSNNARNITSDGWNGIYQAIEQTNQVISGIETYSDTTNIQVRGLYAEALTLRSYLYVDLIKWWGDVPARWVPTENDNISRNITLPPTSRDDIYTHLLSDLLTAERYVNWPGETDKTLNIAGSSSVIRVNLAAVKAFRARVALYAAGYSLRPLSFVSPQTPKYVGSHAQIAKGVTADREQELYTIARTETKSIIDKYGNKLLPNYVDVFKAVTNQIYTWGQTESLWEQAYRNQFFGTTMLADGSITRWDDKGSGGKLFMVPSFFYDFRTGDKRRDVSAVPYKWTGTTPLVGPPPTDAGVTQTLQKNMYNLTFAKLRPEWFSTGSYLSSANDTYGHLVVIRYADVLLMYAEACLNTNTDQADGAVKFNWVRERAGIPDTTLTMDNIVNERAFEFAGERIRKYDLIRWGIMKSKMDGAIANVYALYNKQAPYANVPPSVYTRLVVGPYPNSQVLVIWGLNRGETGTPPDAGTFTYTGPTSMSITNSSLANKYYLYNVNPDVATVNDFNPELRALLPFHSLVMAANSYLVNQYGY